MPTVTLSSKGHITLPKEVREHLGVQDGDSVDFVIGTDGVIRVRAASADVSQLRGLLRRQGRRPVSVQQMDKVIRSAARRL